MYQSFIDKSLNKNKIAITIFCTNELKIQIKIYIKDKIKMYIIKDKIKTYIQENG